MTLGNDKVFAEKLAPYKNLHVRVSIKGTSQEEYHKLTDAIPESYELPFRALKHLIDAGVSCNACVMISFSDEEGIRKVERKLFETHPGLLKALEKERITGTSTYIKAYTITNIINILIYKLTTLPLKAIELGFKPFLANR
jgi:uncharacterized Fe-S cluster-containing radical SAM superfamily protein